MTTFSVTNSNDSGTGSLREAVRSANSTPGKDDIFVGSDINLTASIEITDSVNVGTPYGATINGSNLNDRLFRIDDETKEDIDVDFFRLNLTQASGGAIFSRENLKIVDSQIYNNQASRGAAIYQEGGSLHIERTRVFDNEIISSDSLSTQPGGVYSTVKPNLVNATVYIEPNEIESQDFTTSFENNQDTLTGAFLPEGNNIDKNVNNFYSTDNEFYNFDLKLDYLSTTPVYTSDQSLGMDLFIIDSQNIFENQQVFLTIGEF